MGRGRPRNYAREIEVLELSAQGLRVIEIAKRVGIHRNGVYDIIHRTSNGEDVSKIRQHIVALEEIKLRKAVLDKQEQKARRALELARFSEAKNRLLQIIESARTSILRCVNINSLRECDPRDRQVRPSRFLDAEFANGGNLYALTANGSKSAIEQAVDNERSRLVEGAMSALDEIESTILRLAFFEEKSIDEIAESLGIAAESVQSIQGSALSAMKSLVTQEI